MWNSIRDNRSSFIPREVRRDHPRLYWLAVWGLAVLAALAIGALGGR